MKTSSIAAALLTVAFKSSSHHAVLAQNPTESNETTTEINATATEGPTATTTVNNATTTDSPTVSPATTGPTAPPPIELSSNMTIDWTGHDDTWDRYCGPKTVGGYEIAKKYCSPQTACGLTGEVTEGYYGNNGNDCQDRPYTDLEGNYSVHWMCFTDIRCIAPTVAPSMSPSAMPSTTAMPSDNPTVHSSSTPSKSSNPTADGKTKSPTISPTITPPSSSPSSSTDTPTGSPVEVSTIKTRGYFCGTSYQNAIDTCDGARSCSSNADCNESGGEECYPNVSCEFLASSLNGLDDFESKSDNGGVTGKNVGFVRGGVNGALLVTFFVAVVGV